MLEREAEVYHVPSNPFSDSAASGVCAGFSLYIAELRGRVERPPASNGCRSP